MALGSGWSSGIHPDDQDRVYTEWKQASLQAGPYVSEFRFVHRDGRIVWVLCQAVSITQPDGKIVEWIGTILDLTERKRSEAALLESEKRNRAMLSAIPDLIFVCSREGLYLDCLISDPDALLAPPAEFLGRSLREFHSEELAEQFLSIFRQVLLDQQMRILEYELDLPAGQRWYETRITAMDDQRTLCLVRDVTERKQAEELLRQHRELLEQRVAERTAALEQEVKTRQQALEALRKSEAYNAALLAAIPDPIFVLSREGIFNDCRLHDKSDLLLPPEQFLGQSCRDVLPPSLAESIREALQCLFAENRCQHLEYQLQIGGRDQFYEATLSQLDADSALVVAHNITQRFELAKQLHEMNQRLREEIARANELTKLAEAASRAKSRFSAHMSHELRTPMNAVLGFAQLLARDPLLTPGQAEYIQTINRSAEHLLNLLNEVLDMSKIEAGQTELLPEDFSPHHLLDELDAMFRASVEAKGLEFTVEHGSDLPAAVHGDLGKLRRILVNLLSNAVKFTTSGGIFVSVTVAPAACSAHAAATRLIFEVRDTGAGIAEQDQDHLFDPYYQTEEGARAGGTGLGLSISHEYALFLGGSLAVASQLGAGTRFRLEVPLQRVAGEIRSGTTRRLAIALEPGGGPFRILAVDDNPDNLTLLASLLRPLGFQVREAGASVSKTRRSSALGTRSDVYVGVYFLASPSPTKVYFPC